MYSREELDFIWKNLDHLDDRTFRETGKRLTIMRLYSMGIPYHALMASYEGLNPNECYQKIYEWACKQ
jgi:hypothetical protein